MITPTEPADSQVSDLAPDVLLCQNLPHLGESLRLRHWSLIFYSKDFIEQHPEMELDKFKLAPERYKKLGVKVSKIRKWFLEQALV
jgi:intergrase/recombinase